MKSLEERMIARFDDLFEAVKSVADAAEPMSNRMDAGFAGVNLRLGRVECRLDRVEGRLDNVERRLTNVEDTLTGGFKEFNLRIGSLEKAFL
jgi:hypothetical protein